MLNMKTFKTMLYGVIIYIAINLLMLAASIIFSTYEGADNTALVSINSLAAALPAGLIAFGLAALLKPATRKASFVTGLVWAGIQAALFFLIGLLNQTLPHIFGALGFYVLLVLVLAGPTVYGFVKKLP